MPRRGRGSRRVITRRGRVEEVGYAGLKALEARQLNPRDLVLEYVGWRDADDNRIDFGIRGRVGLRFRPEVRGRIKANQVVDCEAVRRLRHGYRRVARARSTLEALRALKTLVALSPLEPLRPLRSLRALETRARRSLETLISLRTLETRARCSLESLVAGRTLEALWPL